MVPQNVSCSQCVAPGQIQDPVNQVCGKCINQCISCSTLTTCDVCADGYYMTSLQICGLQINLEAELTSTVNAQVLNLLFTECWSSYFLQISNYMNIVIQGISSSSYSYSISNKVNTSLVIITFSFEVDIKLGTWVNLTLNSTDDPNGEFLLLNKTFSIALNPYCVPPYTYLKSNFISIYLIIIYFRYFGLHQNKLSHPNFKNHSIIYQTSTVIFPELWSTISAVLQSKHLLNQRSGPLIIQFRNKLV